MNASSSGGVLFIDMFKCMRVQRVLRVLYSSYLMQVQCVLHKYHVQMNAGTTSFLGVLICIFNVGEICSLGVPLLLVNVGVISSVGVALLMST